MWWFLKKSKENEQTIEYSYGCETTDVTGIIEYNKVSQESNCLKLAEQDTKKGVALLIDHIWGIVNRENAPETKTIAIG